MKQKQTIYKPILWVLFGFALISAMHALIEASIYCYFHYGLSNGFIDIHFQYYIPAFSIVVTFIFSLFVTFILKKKVLTISIDSSKVPWFLFLFLCLVGAALKPLIHIWSNKKVMLLYDDLSKSEYLSRLNLVKIDNTITYSSICALWLLIMLLVIYFLFLNRKTKS